jgi:hypothetical protein
LSDNFDERPDMTVLTDHERDIEASTPSAGRLLMRVEDLSSSSPRRRSDVGGSARPGGDA